LNVMNGDYRGQGGQKVNDKDASVAFI
jgi:hypothetical protein